MSESCGHARVLCTNDFEPVPKYRCTDCDQILICECERNLSARLLPHQVGFARGIAQERIRVDGFAERLCPFCRGLPLDPAPRAPLRSQKGKVERHYWREIKRLYFERILDWQDDLQVSLTLLEFEKQQPDLAERFKREALKHWQDVHRSRPLYDTKEEDQNAFLARVAVPIEVVPGTYRMVQAANGSRVGRWLSETGSPLPAERFARKHYERQGWEVWDCERNLITTLYAVLMNSVIQDPTDPKVRPAFRNSTRGWSRNNPRTPLVTYLFPEDFGTPAYYLRRQARYASVLAQLDSSAAIRDQYDSELEASSGIRDYLWVSDRDLALASRAIALLPPTVIVSALDWTMRDFWKRYHGWPDLLMFREKSRWVEVKSPSDRLSQAQMKWFQWAMAEGIPASICNLQKIDPR